jgi:carbamoyl-phosphate synthase large subunit
VFPFNMFHEADPLLGPEMRSTGEVLGLADSFGLAYYKAQEAAGQKLPVKGTVLVTVSEKDKKKNIVETVKRLKGLGFKIVATSGTKKYLEKNDIEVELINKMQEGRPNIVDAIHNKEINLIINTPIGKSAAYDDSYIRKAAIKYKIPYLTTIAASLAASEGIKAYLGNKGSVKSLQEYHKEIT